MRLKKIIIAILLCIALTGCGVKEPTKVNAPNNVNETEKFIKQGGVKL